VSDRIKQRTTRALVLLERIRAGDPPSDSVLEQEISSLLEWIGFLQHERLIHLIVTVLFALVTMICFALFLVTPSIPVVILLVLFLALLVPYIFHYYRLENGVQKLYDLYDELKEAGEKKNG